MCDIAGVQLGQEIAGSDLITDLNGQFSDFVGELGIDRVCVSALDHTLGRDHTIEVLLFEDGDIGFRFGCGSALSGQEDGTADTGDKSHHDQDNQTFAVPAQEK